jgi:hypothetical protein
MPNLDDKRTWLVGGGVAAAVIAGAGWFFVVSPTMSGTDDLKSQTASAQQQTLVSQQKLNRLAAQRTHLATYKGELAQALAGLPVDTALPEFTRQLSAQAKAAGVQLQGVTIGGIASANAADGSAPASTTTDTATTSSTDAGTATGTTPAAGGAASGGPVSIQVTVNSTGPGARQLAFLHAIQAGPRRALVSSFSLGTATSSTGTTMTLQLNVFATPKTAAEKAQLLKLLTAK